MLCLEGDADLHIPTQEEAGLTRKLERKPRVSCHIPKDTDFPVHSRKVRCSGTSSNVTLKIKSHHEGELTTQLHHPKTGAGFKYNTTSGLSPREQLERQGKFQPHHKMRPNSPVPTLQRPCDQSQKWRGTLRFPPHLEVRPYSSL